MPEIINNLLLGDYILILTSLVAIVCPLLWKNWAKDLLRPEDKFKDNTNLTYETMIENHSNELRMLMNKHYEKLGEEDRDFQTLLTRYSKDLQQQIRKVFYFEGILFEVRGAYNALLYTIMIAIILVILAIFAIASKNGTFCWAVVGANIVLIIIQFGIVLWLRKLKHYADGEL